VDGRDVDHVEAHRGDRVQPPGGGTQGPRLRALPGRHVDDGPLRPGEKLVPRAVERALPVHDHGVPAGPGEQIAERERGEDRGGLLTVGHRQAVQGGDGGVPQRCGQDLEGRPRNGGVALALGSGRPREPGGLDSRALEEQRAFGQRQLHVLAERNLDVRVVQPPGDRVSPRLDLEVPQTLRGHRHLGSVPVGAGRELGHGHERATMAVRPAQHHARPEHPVPFAEDGGTDWKRLAHDGLRGVVAAGHDWLHVNDGDPADHLAKATREGGGHAIGLASGGRVDVRSAPDTY
jgi:hypothetical protein